MAPPPPGASRRARLAMLALFAALHALSAWWFVSCASPGTDAARLGLPLDDAWTYRVYARGIVEGGWPAYNDGVPSNGFSTPLWMLLTAAAYALLGPTIVAVKVLGTLAATASSYAAWRLVAALTGRERGAWVIGVVLATSPTLAFVKLSGMGNALATACVLFALLEAVRGRHGRSGTWGALAFLARPECALLVPFLVVAAVPRARARWRAGTALVVPTAVAGGLWAAWSYAVTGWLLPNTFHAKYLNPGDSLAEPVRLVSELWEGPAAWLAVGSLAAAAGAVALLRGPRPQAAAAVLAFPLAYVAGAAATRSFPAGTLEYFFWWRHLATAFPLLWVPIVAAALHADGSWISPRLRGTALAGFLALALAYQFQAGLRLRDTYAWNCQNVEEMHVALGRWIDENTPADAVVAVNDAGAIRYFGRRRTVDLIGLNDHELLRERLAGRGYTEVGTERRRRWLARHGVDYLVVFPYLCAEFLRERTFPVVHRARSRHLTLCSPPAPGTLGQDETVVLRVGGR